MVSDSEPDSSLLSRLDTPQLAVNELSTLTELLRQIPANVGKKPLGPLLPGDDGQRQLVIHNG